MKSPSDFAAVDSLSLLLINTMAKTLRKLDFNYTKKTFEILFIVTDSDKPHTDPEISATEFYSTALKEV